MNVIKQTYTGKDLIISRRALETLGIRPGDTVLIQTEAVVEAIALETQRKREILALFAEAWSEDDLADFGQQRQDMWQQWS
jgi:hypothetical protein